jgi:hypothetical protein
LAAQVSQDLRGLFNAGGWMHMLVCLKGYLEYGINLRAGGTGHGCAA